jgi:hypothetical protein
MLHRDLRVDYLDGQIKQVQMIASGMYGKRNMCMGLVVTSEGKRTLVKSRCRWKDDMMAVVLW